MFLATWFLCTHIIHAIAMPSSASSVEQLRVELAERDKRIEAILQEAESLSKKQASQELAIRTLRQNTKNAEDDAAEAALAVVRSHTRCHKGLCTCAEHMEINRGDRQSSRGLPRVEHIYMHMYLHEHVLMMHTFRHTGTHAHMPQTHESEKMVIESLRLPHDDAVVNEQVNDS
jgi:hypothetical protein